MRKAGKFGPEGAWTAPEGARGDTLRTAEASENAPPAPAGSAAPPPLPPPAWRGPAVNPTPSPWAIGAEAALFRRSGEPRRGVVARRRVGVPLGGGAFPCPARVRRRSRGGDPGEAEPHRIV
jgi:hypothetical protein